MHATKKRGSRLPLTTQRALINETDTLISFRPQEDSCYYRGKEISRDPVNDKPGLSPENTFPIASYREPATFSPPNFCLSFLTGDLPCFFSAYLKHHNLIIGCLMGLFVSQRLGNKYNGQETQ